MFSLGFTPATNKQGYSKLKFLGAEFKSGSKYRVDEDGYDVIDPKTGSVEIIDWALISMNFDVMGVVKGQWQKVSIACSEKYAEDNLLGKVLSSMGFNPIKNGCSEEEFEEFDTFDVNYDEEGFTEVETDVLSQIEEFISGRIGTFYIAEMYKPQEGKDKNFWRINVGTIEPYVKKESGK